MSVPGLSVICSTTVAALAGAAGGSRNGSGFWPGGGLAACHAASDPRRKPRRGRPRAPGLWAAGGPLGKGLLPSRQISSYATAVVELIRSHLSLSLSEFTAQAGW